MRNFQPHNMYNMGGKGILLGVHSRVQATVHHRHRSPILVPNGGTP